MADVKQLARMLKELDDQLVGCMRCGMCQAVCPVFGQTGRESDVARGKLALLDGLASEILTNPENVKHKLEKCLLCGNCETNCPSGVKTTDIFLKARAILTGYLGLPPAQQAIFRGLLTNPALFNNILGMGAAFQGLFTKKVDEVLGSSCARFQAPIIGDRHFKALAPKAFHKMVPSLDTPRGASGLKVAFFPGCVPDKMYPGVPQAVVKIMAHHGVGVFLPAGQACCGIPALSCGETKSFPKMVSTNLAAFKKGDFDYLVTPCATCSATIAHLWTKFFEGTPAEKLQLKELTGKVMDVTKFLVDVLKVQPSVAPGGKSVTYHDPCHLKNSFGITAQPRAIIKASGAEFKEMADAGACCGCGGSFNVKYYETSEKIGQAKARNIIDSKADVVATACPACMLQITDMLSKNRKSMPVKHVVELYAESLK